MAADHDGWMLYGATGYTGVLLAEEAARRGLRPLLAGRSEAKLRPLAERLNLSFRAVGLDDGAALRRALDGVRLVLHAAGPFIDTSEPMVRACLDAKAHYLDITGERRVFQRVLSLDAEAKDRGVALISGVGFDVVPSDCLARYVADRVSGGARSLEIGVAMLGQPSAGTFKSIIGLIPDGVWVRRGGRLTRAPFGRGVRRLRFPERDAWALPFALGDLETAHLTTGAPDITAYIVITSGVARLLRWGWPALAVGMGVSRRIVALPALQQAGRAWVDAKVHGADEAARAQTRTAVWAKATGAVDAVEAWLSCPDGYDFTAHAALNAAVALLEKPLKGATTPALAFGADFPLAIPGVKRLDALP